MSHKATLLAAAKTLFAKTSREALTQQLDAQKGVIETLQTELGNITETGPRMVKVAEIDAANEQAVVIHEALDLHDTNDLAAEAMFKRASKTLNAAGIMVKEPISPKLLSEVRNRQTLFGRLF